MNHYNKTKSRAVSKNFLNIANEDNEITCQISYSNKRNEMYMYYYRKIFVT